VKERGNKVSIDQELFKMNAHGDIWQEPTLFDQGGDPNITLPAHTFGPDRDTVREDTLEDVWPEDEDWDEDADYSSATGDYGQWD
jgi:hypothetical protein